MTRLSEQIIELERLLKARGYDRHFLCNSAHPGRLGEVGTGFTNESLKSLYSKIQPLEVDECPLDTPVKKEKGFHWAKPKYSCQVQYVEITDDGHVRHPSFLGLRKDK